ncbi:sulfite exporter TauE/SafE family protein [Actinomyces sp. F1_1611]
MLPVYDLSAAAWALLAVASFLIGISKTALPGLATVTVAAFASVIPARESTAVILLLLISGDLVAVWTYRHSVDWRALLRLAPPVAVGVLAGVTVLQHISDGPMKRMIGIILLVLTALTLWLMWRGNRRTQVGPPGNSFGQSPVARWAYGSIGGFTTMVANSGGPPMSLYFIASGFNMTRFLGTQAWFFFLVNLTKVPFQVGLGLHSAASLGTDLLLVAFVLAGAVVGRTIIKKINPKVFNPIIIGLTVVSSVYLLF